MAPCQLPDKSVLRQLLRYDPDSGMFHWRAREPELFEETQVSRRLKAFRWNSRNAFREALTANKHGYKGGTIFGMQVLAHRVAWKWMTGEDAHEIDHINGDKSDNRFANLRVVTRQENSRNKPMMRRNISGHMGVSYVQKSDRWRADINVGDKQVYLGQFKTKAEAVAARRAADKVIGFHPNHGRPCHA